MADQELIEKHVHKLTLNKARLRLLFVNGKTINVTQDGRKYEITPQTECCGPWKEWAQRHGKFAKAFKLCPYCGEEIIGNGTEPVYPARGNRVTNSLKGRHWVINPDGTKRWSRPNEAPAESKT